MLEDIGLMRGLPGMTVLVPADAPSTRAATLAIVEFDGPCYVRLTRENLPTVTDGDLRIGRANEIRAGGDLTIIAVGAMVARALDVAEELHRIGIETRVIDLASVKPFDEKAILRAARDTGAILTMEEHTALTGIGALVASATSENYPVPVRRVGVPDLFGESGEPWTLLDHYGLSKDRALEEAFDLLRLRGKVQ
jgi:transketolase